MNYLQLLGALEVGLIYALVAIAVFITFRIIDFPDLTVDGSFTLGGAVTTALITLGYAPWAATVAALIIGAAAGCITGYLHVKWDILGLLASILTMTALYSVNLRIMQRPNIAIMDDPTIFGNGSIVIVIFIIIVILVLLLTRFFASEFGLAIRAVGINPRTSKAYGINVGLMKIIALCLSNSIVAFTGSLFAQSQGYSDISMGSGAVITGLASVIIGEAIFRPKEMLSKLVACVLGSVTYRVAIAFALNANDIGLEASDLNLITATLVAITMRLNKVKS